VEIVRAGDAGQRRKATDVVGDVLRCPHALGDLCAVVGGHQHPVTDGGLVARRIEVVEPAISRERHRHHHRHLRSVRRFSERCDSVPASTARCVIVEVRTSTM
jgi:hypothetical protein